MIAFVLFVCLLIGSSTAGYHASVPYVTTSQFHSQDELGQYTYGYTGDSSAKQETRTLDGVTRGSYSYVDANGVLQSTYYVADPVHGFRVSATNLPKEPSAVITGPSAVVSTRPARPVVYSAPSVVPPVVHSVAPVSTYVRPVSSAVLHSVPPVASYAPVSSTLLHSVSSAPAPNFDYANGVPLDTPEVAAAKAAHLAAHRALSHNSKRWKRSISSSVPHSTTVVSGPGGKSFSYSTVAHSPLVPIASVHPVASYSSVSPVGISKPYSSLVAAKPLSYPGVFALPLVTASKSLSYSSVSSSHLPATTVVHHSSPSPVYTYSTPVAAAAPVSHAPSYGSQDNYGQYSYGYSDGYSSKTESRTADGVTHGGYSYVDSNGVLQTVKYIADAAGFRVHATNLPVA